MASCSDLATWLAEAETALHRLQIGGAVEMLQHGEKRLQYTKADADKLRAYVADLTNRVAACSGTTRFNRRILRVLPIG